MVFAHGNLCPVIKLHNRDPAHSKETQHPMCCEHCSSQAVKENAQPQAEKQCELACSQRVTTFQDKSLPSVASKAVGVRKAQCFPVQHRIKCSGDLNCRDGMWLEEFEFRP